MIWLDAVGDANDGDQRLDERLTLGARVIMACRDMKKCEVTREKIVAESFNTNVVCRECDLASIESIKRFAEEVNQNEKYVHVLVNNAGVMWHPAKVTKDGFEQHLGVNYLGVSERHRSIRISLFIVFQAIFS